MPASNAFCSTGDGLSYNGRHGEKKMTTNEYIEQRDGGYWIRGTRVSLDSIVYRFLEGLSAESIRADCFPVLTLEQVYGAIAYYLRHSSEVDAYLQEAHTEYESFRERLRAEYPESLVASMPFFEMPRPTSNETPIPSGQRSRPAIVTAVRRLGPAIDFQTAPTLGLHGFSDPEVLALTADQGRVLVSHDRRTSMKLR